MAKQIKPGRPIEGLPGFPPQIDPGSPFGPFHPNQGDKADVDHLWQLPDHVRKWLASLSPEEVEQIIEAHRLYRNAKIVGKFGRWIFAILFGALIAGAAAGDSAVKIFRMVFGKSSV